MKHKLFLLSSLFLLSCSSKTLLENPSKNTPLSLPFQIHNPSDSIQVRHIASPSLALLDLAAYYQNPIQLQEDIEKPAEYQGLQEDHALNAEAFGALDSLCLDAPDFLENTQPVAYEPFYKHLEKEKGDSLYKILKGIEAKKWGEEAVFRPLQKVTKLWGIQNKDALEWWIEVQSAAWVQRPTFWARLQFKMDAIDADSLKKYQNTVLEAEDVLIWAKTLSSYWYPTLNTDLEMHTPKAPWNSYHPYFIIKGNPMGKAIYFAFEIQNIKDEVKEELPDAPASQSNLLKAIDTSSRHRNQSLAMLGQCDFSPEVQNFQIQVKKILDSLPKEQNAFERGGMLWFKRNLQYVLSDTISAQDSLHNPLPRLLELKAYLDSLNIQLLVVPIPVKEEIYPEFLIPQTPANLCVNPNGRDFTKNLLEAGLDVLDLYPALMLAKSGDRPPHYLYQRYDTHFETTGLLASLEHLAARITEYDWYPRLNPQVGHLQIKDTLITREGDLIAHLPSIEQIQYKADTLAVHKIYQNDKAYVAPKNAPILLMGDSFTGVFESIDQKSGGPASLLAYAIGLDVQVLTSWGGGPSVRHRLKRLKNELDSKHLVIYMMTARDFWQSPMEWDAL